MNLDEILDEIKFSEAHLDLSDEIVGRAICAITRVRFGRIVEDFMSPGRPALMVRGPNSEFVYRAARHRAPDVDLHAAHSLLRQAFPDAKIAVFDDPYECATRIMNDRCTVLNVRMDRLVCRTMLAAGLMARREEH